MQTAEANPKNCLDQSLTVSFYSHRISLSVTSLFNPDNDTISKIYEALERKQKMTIENQNRIYNSLSPQKESKNVSSPERTSRLVSQKSTELDSLQQAENQFLQKKISQPQIDANTEAFELRLHPKKVYEKEPSFLSRASSTPSLLSKDFHYSHSKCTKRLI